MLTPSFTTDHPQLREADQSIDRSSKTLSKMIRRYVLDDDRTPMPYNKRGHFTDLTLRPSLLCCRAKQQKLVTVGIIVCLVLLILLILYNKLF